MKDYSGIDENGPYLVHYGTKGMKWRIRKKNPNYQPLTPAERKALYKAKTDRYKDSAKYIATKAKEKIKNTLEEYKPTHKMEQVSLTSDSKTREKKKKLKAKLMKLLGITHKTTISTVQNPGKNVYK